MLECFDKLVEWLDFPDDHYPHITMLLSRSCVIEAGTWLKHNSKSPFLVRFILCGMGGLDYYRIFFIDERDCVLFKLFFYDRQTSST